MTNGKNKKKEDDDEVPTFMLAYDESRKKKICLVTISSQMWDPITSGYLILERKRMGRDGNFTSVYKNTRIKKGALLTFIPPSSASCILVLV